MEYIRNDPGYTRAEMALARENAITRPTRAGENPSVLGPYLAPGLDLPGQNYAYVSARFSTLGPRDALTVDVHYIQSLTDETGAIFLNWQWNASDACVLLLSSMAVIGRGDGDLSRFTRASVIAGARVSW
jgi:hypothetical protein